MVRREIRVHVSRCPITGKVRYSSEAACLADRRVGTLPYVYLCACRGYHRTRWPPTVYDPSKRREPYVSPRYRPVHGFRLSEVARIVESKTQPTA